MNMRKLSSLLVAASVGLWATAPAQAYQDNKSKYFDEHHRHHEKFHHFSHHRHFRHFRHFHHFKHFDHFDHFHHFHHFHHFIHFHHFAHFHHFEHLHHFPHHFHGSGHVGGGWPAFAVIGGAASVLLDAGIVWNTQCRELKSEEAMTAFFLPLVGIALNEQDNKCRR